MKYVPFGARHLVSASVCLFVFGCDGGETLPDGELLDSGSAAAAVVANEAGLRAAIMPAMTDLDTFIDDTVQIDQLGPLNEGHDANLFTGPDPADGSASVDKPSPGVGMYIDWDDLSATQENHRIDDVFEGKDLSAFPGADACVGAANVTPKQELTTAAVANNLAMVELGLWRARNNGDSAYYWIFTANAPSMEAGGGPCSASELWLTYDIRKGDLLVKGSFRPSTDELLEVYQAIVDRDDVDGKSAVNWTDSSLWQLDNPALLNGAVNTTETEAGGWGTNGIVDQNGGVLEPEIFAEGAVDINEFPGNEECNALVFGSVISRPSHSITNDMKDFLGPFSFNLRPVEPVAEVFPSCDTTIAFTAGDADPNVPVTCFWEWDDGSTANTCDGEITLTPGMRTATVTVTNTQTGCDSKIEGIEVEVTEPLVLTLATTPTCGLQFGYEVTVSPDSDPFGVQWTIDAAINPIPQDTLSGVAVVAAPGMFEVVVDVSPQRADGLDCTVQATTIAEVLVPITVDASLTGGCDSKFNFDSTASGSGEGIGYMWTFKDASGSIIGTSTSPNGMQAVGPQGVGGQLFSGELVVNDLRTDVTCTATDSDTAQVYSPIVASLAASGPGAECNPDFSDDSITYSLQTTGGTGNNVVSWLGQPCSGNLCTINPSNDDFCALEMVRAEIKDGLNICPTVQTEQEVYTKTTKVTATDN